MAFLPAMPPPFAEQGNIVATLGKIAKNSRGCVLVDWSCVEVEDEQLQKLGAALKGNSVVRKIHLNFNPAVTDAGAQALEQALPNTNVAAVWLDHTSVSEAAKARIHLLCITNAVRLVATNDQLLTTINWNLVGQTDKEIDTAPLVKASQAADPQWAVDAPVSHPSTRCLPVCPSVSHASASPLVSLRMPLNNVPHVGRSTIPVVASGVLRCSRHGRPR
eukprot:COSAG02_NODE_2324_length_9133_cov_38.463361_15_plen_219_part_00